MDHSGSLVRCVLANTNPIKTTCTTRSQSLKRNRMMSTLMLVPTMMRTVGRKVKRRKMRKRKSRSRRKLKLKKRRRRKGDPFTAK